jgi:hypothetical protein
VPLAGQAGGGMRDEIHLNAATVQDNGVSAHLEDSGNLDWYFASLGDKIDRLNKGEVVTTIS